MSLASNAQFQSMSGAPAGAPPAPGAQPTGPGIDPGSSTLAPNFASYVYNMLGRGEGLANLPYQEYTGQRFAGASPLQQQAFTGLHGIAPSAGTQAGIGAAQQAVSGLQGLGPYQAGTFSTGLGPVGSVESYMNPYTQNVVDIQAREARRQADIGRQSEQARLAQAGAYGGSRQAIMEAERQRNLNQQVGDIQERGSQAAFDRALQQRQQAAQLGLQAQQYGEQSRQFGANQGLQGLQTQLTGANVLGGLGQQQFGQGLQALQEQLRGGAQQRQIEQEPLDFGYQQFQESMKHPYQQTTYMQSLLQGLPLTSRPYESGQDSLSAMLGGGLSGLALYQALFGGR
jgi:hypothetical protein